MSGSTLDAGRRRRSPTGARSSAAPRVALDPACRAGGRGERRGGRSASSRSGEPVYGINTGFGKLASVRIDAADLATLQRNHRALARRRRRRADAARRRRG